MPRVGDELRVLVGRQHGGVGVYMRATVEAVTETDMEVALDTTGAQLKVLDLVEIPQVVREAVREKPSAPRLTLARKPASRGPTLWRLSERLPPKRPFV